MRDYEPLNTLKPVADDLWIVDGPRIRFYGMPFPTRMTAIRLGNGDIWIHSPIRLNERLKSEIGALGPILHLIAPNWIHYAHLNEWRAAFPTARSYCAPGVQERASRRGVRLICDEPLTDIPPRLWAGEIDQLIVKGSRIHREVVCFHIKSKTLILTDLIENFPPEVAPWWLRPLLWIAGVRAPHGAAPRDMRLSFRDRAALRESVCRMIEWAPERIIIAHGDWFDSDGVSHLKRAFAWALDGDPRP